MGGDCLECRQLLSGVTHPTDAAEVAGASIAPRSDSASSDSVDASSAQAGDGATATSSDSINAADTNVAARAVSSPEGEAAATNSRPEDIAAATNSRPEGETTAMNVEQTATSAAAAMSGEGTESGSGVASIQQAVAAISSGPAARQPTSVDPTPWDEGSTGAVAEAPALEQSGGGGTLIVVAAAAASASAGAGAAVPVALSANQAAGSAAAASSVASLGGTVDSALVGEISTDRSLVANVDSTTLPVAMNVGRSPAPRALANLSDPLASTVDGEGDVGTTPGASAEVPPADEPAPSPRSGDMLTEFLPFDRASLEGAIDRFLAPFEGISSELAHWQSPAGLVSAAAVVGTVALAWEGVRRRARAVAARRAERDEDFARFPGYPTGWSLGD
jgi:hypothetical protein